MGDLSILQIKRSQYKPVVPDCLKDLGQVILKPISAGPFSDEIKRRFPKTYGQSAYRLEQGYGGKKGPLKIGVVFSGGQAAGGHNVIAALYDASQGFGPQSQILGFLDGPDGIVKNRWIEISEKKIAPFRNQGGFDLIGSGRTKIETEEQLQSSLKTVREHRLDGLVIIGGDDSNTNAAILAEYFLMHGCNTKVIGVPKTIDGDLQSEEIEISFGFDTACKTYSESIGNIARDALSAKKYYHFIKLMGRSASHIALECALATHPNLAIIGEEEKGLSLIVEEIVDLVQRRSAAGKNYGVLLIPEGLIEFIPEIKTLISELNHLFGKGNFKGTPEEISSLLSPQMSPGSRSLFETFPEKIQKQLLLDRDPHGNVQVSQIGTEQLLIDLVKKELKKRGGLKEKFSAQEHFLGYEGRAGLPSNFDANYCYALGCIAAVAIRDGLTGMICAVQHLNKPPREWRLMAVPLLQLMHLETRLGKEKPVIKKTLVDLQGGPFLHFAKLRRSWEIEDHYRYPGPIQFFGDPEISDSVPLILNF